MSARNPSKRSSWRSRLRKKPSGTIWANTVRQSPLSVKAPAEKDEAVSCQPRTVPGHLPGLITLENDQRNEQQQHHDARDRRGHRPVGIVEELVPHDPPHHERIGAPQHFRNNVLTYRRNEYQTGPRAHTRQGKRQGYVKKGETGTDRKSG